MQRVGTNNDTATTFWRLDIWSSSAYYKGAWSFDTSTRIHHDDGQGKFIYYGYVGVAPSIKQELVSRFNLNGNLGLVVGALSGSVFACVITHPMDTIKTCMQGDVAKKKYKGIVQTGQLLTQEYGVAQGLFKGLMWRIALIATTFSL